MPKELEDLLGDISVLDALIWLGVGFYIIRQLWKSRKALGKFIDVMDHIELLPSTATRVEKAEERIDDHETRIARIEGKLE